LRYTHKDGELVIVTPPVPVSDHAVERLLAELVSHLQRGEPYALVFDLTRAEMPSALQRKRLSQHMVTHQKDIQRQVRGMALVANSVALRGIATAVFWVSPPPFEWRVFDALDAARSWARSRCSAS
jgi:hypothetical protein